MPKLPQPTAEGRQGILALPQPSARQFGAEAFGQLSEFGKTLQEVEHKLQAQRDELQLTDMASQLDLALPQAHAQALQHPIVSERPKIFNDLVTQARTTIDQGTDSEAVKKALLFHQQRSMPSAVIQLQHDSMLQMKDTNDALLIKAMDDTALKLPTIEEPAKRDEALGTIRGLLDSAVKSGLKTQLDAERSWKTFQSTALDHQMDYLRQTNPDLMRQMDRRGEFQSLDPLQRLKHLSAASEDLEKDAAYQEKAFKTVQEAHERDWSAQANQGRLSDFQLSEALAGRNAYITPDKAREYARINTAPPDIGASSPVHVIMQQYHGGPITRSRIESTRRQLNTAARQLGHPSVVLDKSLNELQSDEMSMRTVDAAEKTAQIQYAIDRSKSEATPKLPGMIGTMQKNVEEAEQAEIRMRVRKGEKPDAVLDDIKKRHESQLKAIPERSKGVLELVK